MMTYSLQVICAKLIDNAQSSSCISIHARNITAISFALRPQNYNWQKIYINTI